MNSDAAPRASREIYRGVFSVVPTPFDSRGAIDFDDLRKVVRFLLGTGIDGLVTLGVTSETARLSDRERLDVLECVSGEVAGRLPIVVGATTEGLATTVQLSGHAKAAGAVAVMVGPPRMGRASPDAIVRYFKELAAQAGLDIVLQDYPAVSGFTMDASLLSRMVQEVPEIQAIKLEDPPTAPKIASVQDALGGQGATPIFGGLGGAFLFEELLGGSAGAMTGFAFPEVLVYVNAAYRAGRVAEAAQAFYHYSPVLRFEAQEGLGMAIRKEFLRRRGAIQNAELRQPGGRLDGATLAAIDHILDWSGLLDPSSKAHPWN